MALIEKWPTFRLAFTADNEQELNNVINTIVEFLKSLNNIFSIDLSINEDIKLIDLMKVGDVKIADNRGNFLLYIVKTINVYLALMKSNIFVFYDLFVFMSKTDIEELIKFVAYNKVTLINFTASTVRYNFEEIVTTILDNDLCLITK